MKYKVGMVLSTTFTKAIEADTLDEAISKFNEKCYEFDWIQQRLADVDPSDFDAQIFWEDFN